MKKVLCILTLLCAVVAGAWADPVKVIGANNTAIAEGWYLVQVGTNGNGVNHKDYRDMYICGDDGSSDWGLRLTNDYSNTLNYVYITKNGASFQMEFLHGTTNAWKIGSNCTKSNTSNDLTFIASNESEDNDQWKIWGDNQQRWMGWKLDNKPSVGSTSNWQNVADYNNCSWTFYKVEESEVPLCISALQRKVDDVFNAMSSPVMQKKVGFPKIDSQSITTLFPYNSNNGNVTSDNYDVALAAYNAVFTETDINLPNSGKAYNLISVHPDGKKYYVNYTESGISLVAVGSDPLPETAKFYVNTISAGRYVFATADGNYLAWKGSGAGTNGNKGYTNTFDATESNIGIEKMATGGQYNSGTAESLFGLVDILGHRGQTEVCFIVNNAGSFNQDTSKTLRFNNNHSTAWSIIEVENPNKVVLTKPNSSFEGGLNQKYVGTFSAPYNVELPEGVKAYTATQDGSTINFNLLGENGNLVPKNTGVLVYAENAKDAINKAAIPAATTMPSMDGVDNLLHGTNGSSVNLNTNINAYILAAKEEGVLFYKLSTDTSNPLSATRLIARNKAYLVLPAGSSVSAFRFDFEEQTTGIESVESIAPAKLAFDLSGRSVKANQRGLYILEGKKVIR